MSKKHDTNNNEELEKIDSVDSAESSDEQLKETSDTIESNIEDADAAADDAAADDDADDVIDEQNAEDLESLENPSKKSEHETKIKPPTKKPFFASIKFIVAVLIVVGFSGVFYYLSLEFKNQNTQLIQLQLQIDEKISALDKKHDYQNSISQIEASITSLKSDVNNITAVDNSQLQNQINAQATDLELFRQQLISAATQLNRSEQFKTIEWQLAEAKYLLRIAQQRIAMENDVDGALAVLNAVDEILVNTQDVSLYNIREIVAQDKAKLESVNKFDVEGVYIQLSNVRNQVEQFEFVVIDAEEDQTKKSFRERINTVIKVRDISDQYVGQLDPVLHNIAKQTLVLMLEQAQSSLLNNQQDVFDLALLKSKTQLNQYFSTEKQFSWMTEQLSALQSLELSQELPNVLDSIQALDSYLINLSK